MRSSQSDSTTVESLQALYTQRTGDVSWRHLFVRVTYLQDERQFAQVSPEEFGFAQPEQRLPFTQSVGNSHKRVVSENVSHFRREWLHRYGVTFDSAEFIPDLNWHLDTSPTFRATPLTLLLLTIKLGFCTSTKRMDDIDDKAMSGRPHAKGTAVNEESNGME